LNKQTLILASTSPYRSELLSRLHIPFKTAAPDIDETPLANETANETSWRLSREKALAVSKNHPDSLIIGSDQVALLDNQQIGKPLTHDNAVKQLRAMCGKTVIFYTALTLLNALTKEIQTEVAVTKVNYRNLTDTQIENYLRKEQPYNCAGSVKSEGLGIAVIKSMEGDDPNALVGLPLILLVNMLFKEGVSIL
jgi:septum formation protein